MRERERGYLIEKMVKWGAQGRGALQRSDELARRTLHGEVQEAHEARALAEERQQPREIRERPVQDQRHDHVHVRELLRLGSQEEEVEDV
jgi:hypothetical protein